MSRGEDALRRKAETAEGAGRRYVSDIAVEHVREVLTELDTLRRQRDAAPRIILGIDPAARHGDGQLVIASAVDKQITFDYFHGVKTAPDKATIGEAMEATGYASDWYDAAERERLARGVEPHPFWLPDGYYSPSCMQMVDRDGGGDQCGLASGDPVHDDPREGQDFDWPHGTERTP